MNQIFERPYLIDLPHQTNTMGFIAFAELGNLIEMNVERMFWIKDVPVGAKRGVHAHVKENQVLFCLQGTVAVSIEMLDASMEAFQLSDAAQGLFLPALAWSEITFGEGAILLVISDQPFEEENYIRDKERFIHMQAQYTAWNK
ncbi:MAG: sugar 3,4-ketoisomerase [Mongoliitalea sp.]